MRNLIDFQILDKNAEHYGISLSKLMSNAGSLVAKYIVDNYDKNSNIIIICGKGNNGGDGFVCASSLIKSGFKVNILISEEPKTTISKEKYDNVKNIAKKLSNFKKVGEETDILIDCLLGSGISGNPRPPYDKYIAQMNKFNNIISVDVPSGFLSDNPIVPSTTITFHDLKKGMNKENCGEIILQDVGIPKIIDQKTGPGEMLLFPKLDKKKHKGQNGKVAIIGGGPFSGAPALAGLGAYRAGADLVHLFVPENCYESVSSFIPELIVHKCPGEIIDSRSIDIFKKMDIKFDSIIIGPGIGKHSNTKKAIQQFIKITDNIVIDADAITTYDFFDKNILLTPHSGEINKLGIKKDTQEIINYAKENSVSILFKGETDLITDGYQTKYNSTGHARMAVGGTGDILAGVCGSLMAKGLIPFDVGRLAAYSLGLAGEKAFENYGTGFLATDLSLTLSKILKNS